MSTNMAWIPLPTGGSATAALPRRCLRASVLCGSERPRGWKGGRSSSWSKGKVVGACVLLRAAAKARRVSKKQKGASAAASRAQSILAQLVEVDPRASKEDYFDEDEGEWDVEALESDLQLRLLKEIRQLLNDIRDKSHDLFEPTLHKYLEAVGDPWRSDYLKLQPLIESESVQPDSGAMTSLATWETEGKLKLANYRSSQLTTSRFFSLVVCDVHSCGFVVGAGLASSEEGSKELAARQALERLFFPEEPLDELKRCADALREQSKYEKAHLASLQVVETLEALEGKLQEVHVSAFRPCGEAWMAAISCMCFEAYVLGPSAEYDRQVALALAADKFLVQLKWHLRVPSDEPHEPQVWAQTWEQRKASQGRPWDGQSSVVTSEILRLEALCSNPDSDSRLQSLVPDEKSRSERNEALQKAQRACGRRWRASNRTSPATRGSSIAMRHERIPEAEDPRRAEIRGKLPVESLRSQLGEALEKAQVLVISGGTGSGKTTQVPQFLLDDWKIDGSSSGSTRPRIVVTQPRRIAAISMAERVAWERGEEVGDSIGYAVHANVVRPSSNSGWIEFVTVGTLLRRAVNDRTLDRYSIVVVDEVHDRDLPTDFLLILLSEVLPLRPDLRLVLMSATLDVESFTRYFSSCPALEVQTGSLHPVKEIHLEDPFFKDFTKARSLLNAEGMLQGSIPGQLRWNGSEKMFLCEKLLDVMAASICSEVAKMARRRKDKGAVLCFLPGWGEIAQLQRLLQAEKLGSKMWLLPLHSTLPKEDQQKVFERPPDGLLKVILATNIAESSVTIDDVELVLDSGLQRENSFDPRRRMAFLDTVWISKSGAMQRKGRTGRVRPGRVLRFYSRHQRDVMAPQPSPGMQRCDLAQSCLQAVSLGRDPRMFLDKAPDPPRKASVEAAMEELVLIGAIEVRDDDLPILLPVGEVLSRLPLEPLLGRAALLGCILGVPEATAALLVAAGSQSPFVGNRAEAREAQRSFCSWSDAVAVSRAVVAFQDLVQTQGRPAAKVWAKERNLSPSRLAGLSRETWYLLQDMRRAGLLPEEPADEDGEAEEERSRTRVNHWASRCMAQGDWVLTMLRAVLCSAHPTNLALRMDPSSSELRLSSGGAAIISSASVNSGGPKDHDAEATWWLFEELQASEGRAVMHGTARLQEWQVAIFGGLRHKELGGGKGPCIELDHWLQVGANDPSTNKLILQLREEVKTAYTCKALEALQGSFGRSVEPEVNKAVAQMEAELQSALLLLAGQENTVMEPTSVSDPGVSSAPGEAQPSSVALSDKAPEVMSVAELKATLKEMGLKVSGRKAELQERLSDAQTQLALFRS